MIVGPGAGPAIAIVGMACRLPGAPGKDELWDLVMRGKDAIGPVPETRWSAERYYSPDGAPGRMNTNMGGFITDLGAFDHELFGIPADEAAAMDPRQRLLLECAWHAVEDAGLDPVALAGSRTGAYIGVTGNDWLWDWAASVPVRDLAARQGAGLGHQLTVDRLAHHLDLRGPSVAIDTAGSASLVAVHLACAAVARGECDYALAGGVNAVLSPVAGVYYTQAGLSAASGRCRPFSALADGLVRGEGAGVVVLRRLDSALVDGQPVYAVIRGGAVGHQGRAERPGIPGWHRQRDTMLMAYERAGIGPAAVAFVEADGSGIPSGDAAEARALGAVHNVPREVPCAVGSIKGNLGALEGAAGVASLIKAALALRNRAVPPTVHSAPEDPRLRLQENRLHLLEAPMRLPGDHEVVAGVNAVSMTGTVAHLVLSMVRPVHALASSAPPLPAPGVFTLSAPDNDGLRRNLVRQADYLEGCRDDELGAICFTSNTVKSALQHRFVTQAETLDGLVGLLRAAARDSSLLDGLTGAERGRFRYGLVLPGLDAWPVGAPVSVAEGPEPFGLFLDEATRELRVVESSMELYDERPVGTGEGAALFCVEYALGRTLAMVGLAPEFVAGRGVGAVAAACLAGVTSLHDAVRSLLGLAPHDPRLTPQISLLTADEDGTSWNWETPNGLSAPHLDGVGHLVRVGPPDAFTRRVVDEMPSDPRVLRVAADAGTDLLRLVADLYREGFEVDWDALYASEHRVVHRLAPYAFAKTTFPVRAGGPPRAV